MKNNKKGFTLIELLVVIAIIGLLATLSVVALNNARQKSRDAKRVADIKQIQTALELYYADQDGYPSVATAAELGTGSYQCLDEDGFGSTCDSDGTTYMGQVPEAPTPPSSNAYMYCSTTSSAPTTCAASTDRYMITFVLEGSVNSLSSGTRTATPDGIQ